MKKNSLSSVVGIIFLIALVINIAMVFWGISHQEKKLINSIIEEKINIAQVVNETIISPFFTFRVAMFAGMDIFFTREISKFEGILYIKVFDSNGKIILSSIEQDKEVLPEINTTLQKIQSERKTIVKDKEGEENIKIVFYPGHDRKTIVVEFSLEKIKEEITAWRKTALAASIVFLTIFFLFVYLLLNKFILSPIKEISVAYQKAGKGELDFEVRVKGSQEIKELATSFNKMIKDINSYQSEIEESRQILEIRVRARTRELREFAANLENMIQEKTKELKDRVEELEKFYKITIGRELKMVELKEEIEELKKKTTKKRGPKKKKKS